MNSGKNGHDDLAKASAELVLRELDEIETRDIFGGDGGGTGWVKVGVPVPVKQK